jgi:glycosyltransferase involved in cell wall biosynthesis
VTKVSIAMPVRNNQRTIGAAIRSIINQTYSDWELLLIDDGSSDNTVRIAEEFSDSRIKILSDGSSLGLAARLNQAIQLSNADFFARMDGDDVSYPRRLELQVRYLQEHPRVDVVGTGMLVYDPSGRVLGKRVGPTSHAAICARPASGFPLAHATFVGRTSFFKKYKYRASAIKSQDQDLLLRAYRHSEFANIPEVLYGVCEELNLKKLMKSRYFFARSVWRELGLHQQQWRAVPAIVEQLLKSLVDAVAMGTGLNHRLLRHRARPVSAEEIKQWEEIWKMVNRKSPAISG